MSRGMLGFPPFTYGGLTMVFRSAITGLHNEGASESDTGKSPSVEFSSELQIAWAMFRPQPLPTA